MLCLFNVVILPCASRLVKENVYTFIVFLLIVKNVTIICTLDASSNASRYTEVLKVTFYAKRPLANVTTALTKTVPTINLLKSSWLIL